MLKSVKKSVSELDVFHFLETLPKSLKSVEKKKKNQPKLDTYSKRHDKAFLTA